MEDGEGMSNLNLKGIWIPIEILTDEKLSDKEKIIYAIILYLSKENNYCYLTNKTISELLNVSITQVSKLVNSLKYKKYIDIELIYKENSKQVEMRKLIPINKNTYLTKVKYPLSLLSVVYSLKIVLNPYYIFKERRKCREDIPTHSPPHNRSQGLRDC